MTGLGLAAILAARRALERHVRRTPLLPSRELGALAGGAVYLKLECWQISGSFKVRGALNRLASLGPEEQAQGVVTASAGNHGLGLAHAAHELGMAPPTIFVPLNAAANKVRRLAASGCTLRHAGSDYDETHAEAEQYAAEHGAFYLSAYDDLEVIAGQGTVGLEILEELPDADVLVIPVGGGGLVAGIAVAARAVRPGIQILGVQPEASPSAYLSLRDGRAHEAYAAGPTICDGLAGGFGRVPFEIAARLIDDVLLVPERSIRRSLAWLVTQEQLLAEGSAAIAIAPLIEEQLPLRAKKAVAVLTGRNLDASLLRQCLEEFKGK